MLKLIPIALLAAATVPAAAEVAPAPAAPQQAAPANAQANPLDKMVCRYEDTVGTRLGKHKVCATLREWKDQEDENRQEADRMQQGQGIPTDPMMSPH